MTNNNLKPDKVYLAFKKQPATNANIIKRAANTVVKFRLVSQWGHGGIVVNGELLHVTTDAGLNRETDWNPEKWDLYEISVDVDKVLQKFNEFKGTKYDWFSLLAFVGPKASDSSRLYCFEWMYLAVTQKNPNFRITPEILLGLRK